MKRSTKPSRIQTWNYRKLHFVGWALVCTIGCVLAGSIVILFFEVL